MNDLSKRTCKGIRFVVISPAGLRNFFLTSVQRRDEVNVLHRLSVGKFLQFLDRDELCHARPDTPLFAFNSVQNQVEARLSIGFSAKRLHSQYTGAKPIFSRVEENRLRHVVGPLHRSSLQDSRFYLFKLNLYNNYMLCKITLV